MRQYEPGSQIIIYIKKRIKTKNIKRVETDVGVRARGERNFFYFFFSSLLSKIYGKWIVGFHRSKKQSSFTRRELRVSTKILEFRQTLRGR